MAYRQVPSFAEDLSQEAGLWIFFAICEQKYPQSLLPLFYLLQFTERNLH